MNFSALDEQVELMAPGPVEAIRRRFGPSVPLVIRNANEDCIPFQLRGALRKEFSFGPVEHVVAVTLSGDCGNLAAVACNSPEQLAAFEQANPALQASLVTRWKDWRLLWLRTDPRPENFTFEPWMWLAQGTIPLCFTADDEEAVPIAREGAPVEIPSSEIQWPGILFEPFRMARLIQSHGPLFLQKNGRRILNEFFWANWLAEKLELTYDSKLGAFRRGREQGTEVQTLTTAAVIQLMHQALQQAASVSVKAGAFPIRELRLPRIKQLVEVLKVATVEEPQNVAEGLEIYLAALRQDMAATLTTEEMWHDYVTFCRERCLQTYPKFEFLRIAPARIRELFGVAKAHDIQRDGKPRRGFRGIAKAATDSKSK